MALPNAYAGECDVKPYDLDACAIKVEQGGAVAQFKLGWMYAYGKGASQDYKQAFKWFLASAKQKHASAQFNLRMMYLHGNDVPKDCQQAIK